MQHDSRKETTRPLITIAIPTYNRSRFLRQLLDSLAEQVRNDERVELLVSDNASTDGTASLVKENQRNGTPLRYIQNAENVGADANILQCYERASGKYVWIVGDDDLLCPGAIEKVLSYLSRDEYDLVYVSPTGFTGDSPDLYPLNSGRRVLTFANAAQFVRRVHVHTTLISCNIINRDRVAAIEHQPFSKLINSSLIQLGWIFTALRGHRKSLFFQEPLVSYRHANTGGYGVCRVFGVTLFQITEEWLGVPELSQLIRNAILQRFLPSLLLAANRKSPGKFLEEDAHAVLSSIYRDNFRYWFFDYPLIVLPGRLAWLWLQMLRVINRVDRACGLPLLRW
jgi:abequosyltransferase